MSRGSFGFMKFCIEVKPYMEDARQTYISESLFERIKDSVPEKIKFIVKNGDVFEGHFIASKHCFVGFRELLKRYNRSHISLLELDTVERVNFTVTLFDIAAIEIDYPIPAVRIVRRDVDFRRVPHPGHYKFSTDEGGSLDDRLNRLLLHYNAGECNVLKASIYMPEQYYQGFIDFVRVEALDEDLSREWVDGSSLCLTTGKESWTVTVNKKDNHWFISTGWMKFATDLGVNCTDMVELCFPKSHFTAEVLFYKNYASVPTCVEKELERPSHFFKIVTELFLHTGEMTIPCLYHWKYDKNFDAEVEIVVATGAIYPVLFLEFEQKLVKLKDFAFGTNLQVGYTIVFSQMSQSQISVTIYDKDLVVIA